MKKLIALLLVAVMCLSFAACDESGNTETPSNGENTENNSGSTSNTTTNENDSTNDSTTNENETTNDTTNGDETANNSFIYQEWREIASGGTLIFDKDGNMHRNDETYKYEYDKELELISVFYHQTINMKVVFEEDTYKLKVAGEVYVPSEEYERFHSAYVTEKLSSLTEGKTELVIGNTYTTASGKSFNFIDAGLIGDDIETRCGLALYLDQYGVSFDNVEYSSPSYHSISGICAQDYWHKENAICYGGLFGFTKAELEADRNAFGILSFAIDGTSFYVSVDTFFE